jgi:hypothetical protein
LGEKFAKQSQKKIKNFLRQTYLAAQKTEREKIIGVIEKMIPQREVEYRIHHTFNNEIRDIFFDFLAKLRDV